MVDPGRPRFRRGKLAEAIDVMILGLLAFFGGILIINFVMDHGEAALALAGIVLVFGLLAVLRHKHIADAEGAAAAELAMQSPLPLVEEIDVQQRLNALQETREEDFRARREEAVKARDDPAGEGRYPPR